MALIDGVKNALFTLDFLLVQVVHT